MAYNSAQLEKDRRGFRSPMIDTPPAVIGKLQVDIALAREKLAGLLDVEREVEISLWSDLQPKS